jgi:hypothetical protein
MCLIEEGGRQRVDSIHASIEVDAEEGIINLVA